MRVLWFTITPGLYRGAQGLGYNGGGWIASLQREMMKTSSLELGVAFISGQQFVKDEQDGTAYYVVPHYRKTWKEKLSYFTAYDVDAEVSPWLPMLKRVVDDFRPDIIQVFGSEGLLGFVQRVTDVPCVLHIQGILNPYWTAYFPPAISRSSIVGQHLSPLRRWRERKLLTTWQNNCTRERALLQQTQYHMGRTAWDEIIVKTFNPQAQYFYCSEILRESFYADHPHVQPDRMVIVSTMSGVMYKGLDLVLHTAQVLKHLLHADFEWRVYGSTGNVPFFERQTGIRGADVNVRFCGVASEQQVCDALCAATAFAQVSYIDNSPNAVCEAQMVGCPVVSTNVGGVPSLIEDGRTGILVPANDPYQMAWHLLRLHTDRALNQSISTEAKQVAHSRHDKAQIATDLLGIYRTILTQTTDHGK